MTQKYKMIQGFSTEQLEKNVQKFLDENPHWWLHYSPQGMVFPDGSPLFFQAVTSDESILNDDKVGHEFRIADIPLGINGK